MRTMTFLLALACLPVLMLRLSADDNREDVKNEINSRYQSVKWGKEIDHLEYLKFIASIAGGPPAVAAYFGDLIRDVGASGAVITAEDVLKVLKGEKSEIASGTNTVYVGIATYNHWRKIRTDFPRFERTIPLSNTHQFYIAINKKPGSSDVQQANCQLFFADMDGDGKVDRILVNAEGGWYVLTANGQCGVPGIPWGSKVPGWPGNGRYFIADFNGDKKADRAFLKSGPNGGEWYVVDTESGAPGVPGIDWGSNMAPGMAANGPYFIADFDGDGKADRAYLGTGRDGGEWFVVATNNSAHPPGTGVPGIPWGKIMAPGMSANGRYFIADFDGDGKADRAYLGSGREGGEWFVVATNNSAHPPGTGVPGYPWGKIMAPGMPADGYYAVADFEGSKKAVRAFLRGDAKWFVVNSGGGPGVFGIPWDSWPHGWPGPSSILNR